LPVAFRNPVAFIIRICRDVSDVARFPFVFPQAAQPASTMTPVTSMQAAIHPYVCFNIAYNSQ
jgi:hypothetical protein